METAARSAPPPSIVHRVVNDEPVSVEKYLERERTETEGRHEYIDGWVIRVSGASLEHNVIASNLNRILGNQLRDTECRALANDLRVALPSVNKFAYPDILVYCGESELEENHLDMLYNPRVIVEVLSSTTEDYDRSKKISRYRRLDSLREYVLVAQDRTHVEHYVRQDDASWRFTETDGLDAEIDLPTLDAALPLSEVYLDVSVESDENE